MTELMDPNSSAPPEVWAAHLRRLAEEGWATIARQVNDAIAVLRTQVAQATQEHDLRVREVEAAAARLVQARKKLDRAQNELRRQERSWFHIQRRMTHDADG